MTHKLKINWSSSKLRIERAHVGVAGWENKWLHFIFYKNKGKLYWERAKGTNTAWISILSKKYF
jgi:hypothetical protein